MSEDVIIYAAAIVIVILLICVLFLLNRNQATYSNKKILIGIITIDRDTKYIPTVSQTLQHYLSRDNIDLMVVTRITDTGSIRQWRKYTNNIITVPHYEIGKRHNFKEMAKKRNIILDYAIDYDYDYVWFIDSDVIVKKTSLLTLIKGMNQGYNMVNIPYMVRWLNYPCILDTNRKIRKIYDSFGIFDTYGDASMVGMGCTLIEKSLFDINFYERREEDNGMYVTGEDIGFCHSVIKKGFKIGHSYSLVKNLCG